MTLWTTVLYLFQIFFECGLMGTIPSVSAFGAHHLVSLMPVHDALQNGRERGHTYPGADQHRMLCHKNLSWRCSVGPINVNLQTPDEMWHKRTRNSKTTYDTHRNMKRLHGPSMDRDSLLVHDGWLDAERDTLHRHGRNLFICFLPAVGLMVFKVLVQTFCPLTRAADVQRNIVLSDPNTLFGWGRDIMLIGIVRTVVPEFSGQLLTVKGCHSNHAMVGMLTKT